MNGLDITLICLTGLGFVKGLFDGIIKQVVSLIAILITITYCGKVALMINEYLVASGWFSDSLLTPASYLCAILLIFGVLFIIGGAVDKIIGATPLGIFNHLLGGVLGMVTMLLICSALINLFEFVDPKSKFLSEDKKKSSNFYYSTETIIPAIYSLAPTTTWWKSLKQ